MHQRPKRLVDRGGHLTLPIVGDTVSEVCVFATYLPSIAFRDPDNGESELQIDEALTLSRGGTELRLSESRDGVPFDPRRMSPLLDLLGTSVVDAWAHQKGRLEIVFSSGWTLRVEPGESYTGYQAWQFWYPRPYRPVQGDVSHHIHLRAAEGRLL